MSHFRAQSSGRALDDGEGVRLYSSCCNYDGVVTKYMQVTLGKGESSHPALAPVYPPESVSDFNPGWDRDFKP